MGFIFFVILFCLTVQLYNNGYSLFIICKWLAQKDFSNISASFQNLFVVVVKWKGICTFYTYLFCCTEMRWLFISLSAIWATDSDTSLVACRARTELTRSKCEWTRIWTIQNVDETNQRTDGICNHICIRSHWNTGRFGTLPDLHQSTPFIPLWISKILITCPCPKLIMIEKK